MPVAKTYAKMEISGEPFVESKRTYVNVITPKGLKKVRWYTEAEYRRMYSQEEVKYDSLMDFNARHAFGFGNLGFITIYKGNQTSLEECAETHHNNFRRNLTFGYYTPSHINICSLPDDVIPVKLNWEEVMDHDDRMKPHEEVRKYVMALLNPMASTSSSFQGTKDEWLEKEVKVRDKKTKDSHFGTKHTYSLVDAESNTYIWETGAKDYQVDAKVNLKMKVKEHKEINGEKCTVVWYCKEV